MAAHAALRAAGIGGGPSGDLAPSARPGPRCGISSARARWPGGRAAPTPARYVALAGGATRGTAFQCGTKKEDKRKRRDLICAAGGGGGDGGSGEGNGGRGGGGGGGDDSGGNEKFPGFLLAMIAKGWSRRVEADPNFAFKLGVECFNDALIIIAVNAANRKQRFFAELEFVLSHIAVSLLCDISLVWLLAPLPATAAAVSAKGLAAVLASLPSHCFQAGSFSLEQRVGCLAYKSALYAGIGLLMGMTGTTIVHTLTSIREKVDPDFKPPAEIQPIVKSGLVWAGYMGTSSNFRYQTVNGLERLLYSLCPENVARVLTVAMRLGNNFLGSMSFVWLAKLANLNQPRTPSKPHAQVVAADLATKQLQAAN